MIEQPKRSVTRFFVPLIDVLILLFCIFILMPFVSQPGAQEGGGDPDTKRFDTEESKKEAPLDPAKLKRDLDKALEEIKSLKDSQTNVADRIHVRVLEIDSATGRLFYFVEGERREIRNELDAQRLIDEHRRVSGKRDPFFLILYPRQISGYPEQQQVDNYRRWFRNVPVGFDNPLVTSTP